MPCRLDLREALDELSPAHREVLELQYGRDLTQAQVAAGSTSRSGRSSRERCMRFERLPTG